MRHFAPLVALCCAFPCVALSQVLRHGADSTSDGRHGRHAVELWAGYAARSPDLGILGRTAGRHLTLAAGRVSRVIAGGDAVVLDYTVEVVPLALLSQPTYRVVGPLPPPCTAQFCALSATASGFVDRLAYGAGGSPVGLTATFRPKRALQLRVGGTGGVLWFDRAVPTEGATRLNFTGTAEAGAQLLDRYGRGILVVYRFHHLSNAGTSPENLGLASHVVSLGARWRLSRR